MEQGGGMGWGMGHIWTVADQNWPDFDQIGATLSEQVTHSVQGTTCLMSRCQLLSHTRCEWMPGGDRGGGGPFDSTDSAP